MLKKGPFKLRKFLPDNSESFWNSFLFLHKYSSEFSGKTILQLFKNITIHDSWYYSLFYFRLSYHCL